MIHKILNIIYGSIGLILTVLTVNRLYEQGFFGNIPAGILQEYLDPTLGLLVILFAISLLASQIFDFFRKKKAIFISLFSLIIGWGAIGYNSATYGYIWDFYTDTLIFGLILTICLLPILVVRMVERKINNRKIKSHNH